MFRLIRPVSLLAVHSSFLFSGFALGSETLREIDWADVAKSGRIAAATVVRDGRPEAKPGVPILRIQNSKVAPLTATILTIENPAIRQSNYALIGSIRHSDVAGKGYLEMWNYFPTGDKFFTRTLGSFGLMESLEGTSDWREFALPFMNKDDAPPPEKLVLNVVLPGRGTVELSSLKLIQYASDEDPFAVPGHWWSDRSAGFLGAIFGCVCGVMGALLGVLTARAKARRFVFALINTMIVIGIVSLIAGVVAVFQSQPYAVFYPLLLVGGILTLVASLNRRSIRRKYDHHELRKMNAADVG